MQWPSITASRRGFLLAFAGWVVPALPVGLVVALGTSRTPPLYPMDTAGSVFWAFFGACIVAPLLETLVLMWPTSIALQAIRRRWLACVVGCLPIVLLHLWHGWPKAVAVFLSFAWGAYCYALLTEQGESLRTRFAFLAGIHALGNLLLMSLLLGTESFH